MYIHVIYIYIYILYTFKYVLYLYGVLFNCLIHMSFEPLLGSGPVGSRTSLDTAAPWPGNETEAGWNIPGLFENIGKPWENCRKNPPFTSYSSFFF